MWTQLRRGGRTVAVVAASVLLAVGLTGIGTASASPVGVVLGADGPDVVPGSYLVTLRSDTVGAVADRHGVKVTHTFSHAGHGFAATMSHRQAQRLAADPRVAAVERDREVTALSHGVQPNPGNWGLDRIDQVALPLDGVYRYPNTGAASTIYVIDTGIDFDHPEFGGRAVRGTDTVGDGGNGQDCNGHGTHLASLIGGTTFGVAKRTTLVSVRVLNCNGSATIAGVIAGIDWVAANHARNSGALLALGGGASATLDNAVRQLVASGVSTSVAAGGSATSACNFSPARVAEALTVGAVQSNDQVASFSNHGPCVDIYAPGVSITGAWPGGGSVTISGTSPAAAFAAGAFALYLTKYPGSAPATVHGALVSNASPPNGILYIGFIPHCHGQRG